MKKYLYAIVLSLCQAPLVTRAQDFRVAFFVIKQKDVALIKFKFIDKQNTEWVQLQKSVDGIFFSSIDSILVKKASVDTFAYRDTFVQGRVWYRLKGEREQYSEIQEIIFRPPPLHLSYYIYRSSTLYRTIIFTDYVPNYYTYRLTDITGSSLGGGLLCSTMQVKVSQYFLFLFLYHQNQKPIVIKIAP